MKLVRKKLVHKKVVYKKLAHKKLVHIFLISSDQPQLVGSARTLLAYPHSHKCIARIRGCQPEQEVSASCGNFGPDEIPISIQPYRYMSRENMGIFKHMCLSFSAASTLLKTKKISQIPHRESQVRTRSSHSPTSDHLTSRPWLNLRPMCGSST